MRTVKIKAVACELAIRKYKADTEINIYVVSGELHDTDLPLRPAIKLRNALTVAIDEMEAMG